jgi:basic membrane protein A
MSRSSILCGVLAGVLALTAVAGGSAASPPEKFKVGLVLSPGGGYSYYDSLAEAGLRKAIRNLGIEATVRRPGPKEGYLPTFLYLARGGYDLVLAGSALQVKAVDLAAVEHPDVRFAALDVPHSQLPHRPANAVGVTFRAQEAAYLAGYLAGNMEKRRPGRDAVSSVGGVKAPPVDDFVGGYQAGARKADPRVVTLHAYVQSFTEPARCEKAALAQIAKGSGVVFPVAGYCGLGALEAAREKGVWGIGVDGDQSKLGPHILTSVLKNVDVAVYETIRRARQGSLGGGRTIVFGLRERGVGLGKISPRVPRSVVANMEGIRRLIAAGKIEIPTTVR